MAETLLIVDDEDSVRRTFRDWLESGVPECALLDAPEEGAALNLAKSHQIDLAILDWNLGTGANGLELLESLRLFCPDVVAIMVTGYAHQATPLDAMRMGVRDYLDKNTDLTRENFLAVVGKQLDQIRPAKRERQFFHSLKTFRETVEKVVPLVETTSSLNAPLPLTQSIRALMGFLQTATGASEGIIIERSFRQERAPEESFSIYDLKGNVIETDTISFADSIAGAAVSMHEPCLISDMESEAANLELQPFEKNRRSLLACGVQIAPGLHLIIELFDKKPEMGGPRFGFSDKQIISAVCSWAAELFRKDLAGGQKQGMLLDAVQRALDVSRKIESDSSSRNPVDNQPDTLDSSIRSSLENHLEKSPFRVIDGGEAIEIADIVRQIVARHGPRATQSCIDLLRSVNRLLTAVTSEEDLH